MKAFVKLDVYDKDSKLIKTHKEKCRSFLKNFILALKSMTCTVPGSTIHFNTLIDVDGNSFSYPSDATQLFRNVVLASNSNLLTKGIVIGTGDVVNTVNTYALASLITSGFSVVFNGYSDLIINDNELSFDLYKKFLCQVPLATIKEVGIYANALDRNETMKTFCIARDVLLSPVEVIQDQVLVVTYTFKISVG